MVEAGNNISEIHVDVRRNFTVNPLEGPVNLDCFRVLATSMP